MLAPDSVLKVYPLRKDMNLCGSFRLSCRIKINKTVKKWWTTSDKDEKMLHIWYPSDIIEFSWIPQYKNVTLLHQKYVEEKRTTAQIAKDFKCSTTVIKHHLAKAGIPRRRGSVISLSSKRAINLILEYSRLGMSGRKIADALNQMGFPPTKRAKSWGRNTVYLILKQYSK